MKYKELNFKEQLDIRASLGGIKDACKLIVKDIQDLLKDNPNCGYIIKLNELNLGDSDVLDALAEIRHSAGDDNNRIVFDGSFLNKEVAQMLIKLGILDDTISTNNKN